MAIHRRSRAELIEEEKEALVGRGGNGYGSSVAVMVVEYLESSMSTQLLCKFLDNSAFDFNYSQSSIWSPLVPRTNFNCRLPFPAIEFASSSSSSYLSTKRKLSFEDGNKDSFLQKVSTKIGRKMKGTIFKDLQNYHKMKKKPRKSIDLCPATSSLNGKSATPTPRKGWARVLKAACKHFKKRSKKKERNANYLTR